MLSRGGRLRTYAISLDEEIEGKDDIDRRMMKMKTLD
jgi:hypothetical protein